MKKKLILFTLSGVFLFLTLSSWFNGIGFSGYGDRTGASGSSGCGGSGCHGTSATSSTTITLQLLSSGSPTCVYVGGNTYTIRITATNTGSTTLSKWGYQLSAVGTGGTTSKGSFTAPSGSHVGTYSGVTCVEPSNYLSPTTGSGGSGSTYVQDITWVAPSSGTGSVTIYTAVNLTNYSFSADAGDLWNLQSLVISESGGGSISGTTTVCPGATTSLSTSAGGGTWSSSSTGVATVGTSGVVTGVAVGTSTISYVYCAGTLTTTVTVTPGPASISGTSAVCQGLTTTLSNSSGSGTWTSSATTIATIGSGTGVVSGVSSGTSSITFTLSSTGCKVSAPVTVNPLPPNIVGTLNVCVSGTTALSDGGGGTWQSSNTAVATVGSGSGIVSGVSAGTAGITYTLGTGCLTSVVVTVNPLPAAITGNNIVCPNLTTTLSDATGTGNWSSSSTSIAVVGSSSGVVTGVSGGTATISYKLSTGCSSTFLMSVYAVPPSITGTRTVCEGLVTSLSHSTGGGNWSSGNTTIATVNSTGDVSGIVAGTTFVTYTLPSTGCISFSTVTVNPLPASISGITSVCQGGVSSLSDATPSGTWLSSNTSIATITPGGFVNAVLAGTSTITYTLNSGCINTTVYTVNPLPSSITGAFNVCSGQTTALTDAGGGTWSSSNTTVATVGATSGIVSGVGTFGIVNITYTLPVTACKTTASVTVNLLPGAINGTASVCEGATTGLSDITGGGTWSVSNTSVATINSSGVLSGVSSGTTTVTYTVTSTGCTALKVATVNPAPASISGTNVVCSGSTTALTDATPGGVWSTSSTVVVSVGTSGIVTGNLSGTATVTYTVSGCRATTLVTVNPLPATITGTLSVCGGSTTNLSDASGGGTWTSTNTTVATVGPSSGIVSGGTTGTSTISYTIGTGCAATKVVTVSPAAGAITGAGLLCKGLTLTLSDAGGGTWNSGNTAIATVGLSSGVVTGVSTGSATITYTLASGCKATQAVTVNALSPITGTTSLCAGLTTTLSDATNGGKWSSSNTAVATIGSTSGFVNTFVAGTSVIDYTMPTGCVASVIMSVVSAPSAITGSTNACTGSQTALSDAGGGTWISSNTSIATVGLTSGLVTGVVLGSATITYSLGSGCSVTTAVTVYPSPAAISGASVVCEAGSITLSDATGTGTWNSPSGNITIGSSSGIVNALTAGTAIVSYSLSTGCSAIKTITVNPSPGSVSGSLEVCVSASSALSDGGGGTWLSSNTSVATVSSSSGLLTGVGSGTSLITYTLPVTGCATVVTATVDPLPSAISGPAAICTGIMTTYTNSGGGTWSSANTIVAVTVTGDVTGLSAGTAIITYYLPTGCSTTKSVTVNTSPAAITGSTAVCELSSTSLSDPTSGGKWSSSTTTVATIGSVSALVSGLSAGTTMITYRLTSGCESYLLFTVDPLPGTITGTKSACSTGSTQLSNATTGGTWSSSNTSVASIDGSGLVSGLIPGTSTIAYTLGTGCKVTAVVTVNPLPGIISGPSSVCSSASITLSDAGVGTWASGNTVVATVGAGSGIVNGVSGGTAIVTYKLSTGCEAYKTITVNNSPAVVTGAGAICVGASLTLSDATSGGDWSSGATSVATVGSTSGLVSGVSNGSVAISYTLSTGCYATALVTVNPLPAVITGTNQVCAGFTTNLSDITTGGSWSSSATSIATVGTSSGVVSGVTAGTSSIAYVLSTGCSASVTVTVNPMPAAISGASGVCVGTTTLLSDSPVGGTWVSSSTPTATIGSSSGLVSGIAAGSATITYALSTGCKVTKPITVNPLPFAGALSGPSFVCVGASEAMSSSVSGGSWASGSPSVATIDASTGAISGVSAGTSTISYSVTNICGTDTKTIDEMILGLPAVSAITGIDSVCVGYTITLVDTATGGTWSSSDPGVATISAAGVVTGVAPGTAIVSFTITTPCGPANAHRTIRVNPVSVCKTLVGSVTNPDAFKVYPNPSVGQFVVEIPSTASVAVVTIMDMLGKVIVQKTATDNHAQKILFDLSDVARGSYMVKVSAGDAIFRQKIEIW